MNLQASSRNCFVCGVENDAGLHMHFYETETEPYVVTAEYTVPRRYQGYPGIVHGGIVAAMMDEVTSRVVMRGDPPRFVVTARLNLRYRKPVPVETLLRMTGRVVQDKGRVVTVAGEMVNPDGVVLAEAEAVLMEVDGSYFEAMTAEEEQGWRVYETTNDDSPQAPDGGEQ
jgi:acyl-coenzyme A thioesterase PaaI-like protein